MQKRTKKQLGLYNALKEWFDPATEGSPYDFGGQVKKTAYRQVRPFAHKAWMTA